MGTCKDLWGELPCPQLSFFLFHESTQTSPPFLSPFFPTNQPPAFTFSPPSMIHPTSCVVQLWCLLPGQAQLHSGEPAKTCKWWSFPPSQLPHTISFVSSPYSSDILSLLCFLLSFSLTCLLSALPSSTLYYLFYPSPLWGCETPYFVLLSIFS